VGLAWFEAMEMNYRSFGDEGAKPLVIVHGFLGSSRNWQSAAAELGKQFRVYALDLRNHGDSPHTDEHSYEVKVEDVVAWMDARNFGRAILLGHSMGGKLMMKLACENPSRVDKLIVVDIAPKVYPHSHDHELAAMLELDTASLESRKAADDILMEKVPSWGMRQFLLTNLVKSESGGFHWQSNIETLYANRRKLESACLSEGQQFDGDTLFVVGGESKYFTSEDIELVRKHFPTCAIETIPNCGHNPHFEKRAEFVEIVSEFCG